MRRTFLAAGLLAAFSGQAVADDRLIEQAQAAIRALIQKSSPWPGIYFTQIKQDVLSGNEARVFGEGVVTNGQDWNGMPFRYSVKVDRNLTKTRDGFVSFADGIRLVGKPDWNDPMPSGNWGARITTPLWYETVGSSRVTFRGISQNAGPIAVRAWDQTGAQRGMASTKTSRPGPWSLTMNLPDGTYRASAMIAGLWAVDEVRFNVRRASGFWGGGKNKWNWDGLGSEGWNGINLGKTRTIDVAADGHIPTLSVNVPVSGQAFRGPTVSLDGECTERIVHFVVYRGSIPVDKGTLNVSRGRWSHTSQLSRGSYRLVVTSNKLRSEVSFSVR